MQCIADEVQHQVQITWYAHQSPASDQLTAVVNAPGPDARGERKAHEVVVGM